MNTISVETATSASRPSPARLIEAVIIPSNGIGLPADLVVPAGAQGLVVVTVTAGCIRETPLAYLLARAIEARGVATLSLSLLTRVEAEKDGRTGYWSFELALLAHRLLQATSWAMRQPQTRDLGIGYTGTSTFAAAALVAAGQLGDAVQGVVARSGRPDFAGDSLPRVTAPTLLIVGERDEALMEINRRALDRLVCPKRLSVIAGAGHLFEEPGALEQVGELAANWFTSHLKAIKRT